MRGDRTPLSNGLRYGLMAGLFGGSLWTLITLMVPEEERGTWSWVMRGVGLLGCFFAGFLVGVFNTPSRGGETTPSAQIRYSFVQRMLTAIGWFFYRLLVGWFVGILGMAVFSLVWFILFAGAYFLLHLDRNSIDHSSRVALLSSVAISVYGSFSGGLFGALATTRRSPSHRPAIGARAARSSFLAFLFGVLFGASLGWLPAQAIEDDVTPSLIWLTASMPIGILAGILGGIWTDVRCSRGGWNN